MERIGDAFVWPFRDPKWVEKVAIIGLISLIPIVGGINGFGWMLASIERLRAGKEELPPGNFDYLGRGAILFLVLLVYSLVKALRLAALRPVAIATIAVFALQVAVGAGAAVTDGALFNGLHVAIATLVWAGMASLALLALPRTDRTPALARLAVDKRPA